MDKKSYGDAKNPIDLQYPPKFTSNYVPPRTVKLISDYQFVEGEIFFVSPMGWRGVSQFGESHKNHPGCVVIPQKRPRKPVVMIPGTSQPRENEQKFFPQYPLWRGKGKARDKSESAFLYLYATPIKRHDIVSFLGVLETRDISRLLDLMSATFGPRWRDQYG